MSGYDDDNIEFDFFDEPETAEATGRRRLPRLERPGGRGGGERPPRAPLRAPTGLVPLARLVGLIAIAIVIVVGLVFWVGSCQGKSKQAEYQSYAEKVRTLTKGDKTLGTEFGNEFIAASKQADLETSLQRYAQRSLRLGHADREARGRARERARHAAGRRPVHEQRAHAERLGRHGVRRHGRGLR